jgi:hypothetical protein
MLQIPTLAIILGAVGALLIMVGVLGGGFSISTTSVPKVGLLPRVVSFVVGGFLVVSAIGVGILDNPALTQDPDTTVDARDANGGGVNSGATDGRSGSGSSGGSSSGSGAGIGYPAKVMATPGYNVYLFEGPSLSASYVTDAPDGLQNGQAVEILCTMQGDPVTFAGYTSSLWNGVSVGNGVVGFIPDAHLDTPVQPTMPNCETLWNETNGAV